MVGETDDMILVFGKDEESHEIYVELIDEGRNFKVGMAIPAHPRLFLTKITTWKGGFLFQWRHYK